MDPFLLALLGSAGANAFGGFFNSGASRAAGRQQSLGAMMSAMLQAQQAQAAQAMQERMYRESIARMEPFRQGGVAATNRMLELYGIGGNKNAAGYGSYAKPFSMADFQADPGYAFRVQQGQQALDRSAAARAGLQSGDALKAAARFGQEMGSQEYGNAYNRFLQQRQFQMQSLQGLATPGAQMAATGAQIGAQFGSNIANTMMMGAQALGQGYENSAAARASSYMGGASALSGALNGLGQNFLTYNLMNRFAPR